MSLCEAELLQNCLDFADFVLNVFMFFCDFFHCLACAFDMRLLNYLLTYLLRDGVYKGVRSTSYNS